MNLYNNEKIPVIISEIISLVLFDKILTKPFSRLYEREMACIVPIFTVSSRASFISQTLIYKSCSTERLFSAIHGIIPCITRPTRYFRKFDSVKEIRWKAKGEESGFWPRNAYNDRVQLVFHPIIRTCRAIYCSGNSFLGQQARVAREIRRGTRIVSKMGGEGERGGRKERETGGGHPGQCQLRYRNITRSKRGRLLPIGTNCSLGCWYRLLQIVYEKDWLRGCSETPRD